VRFSAPFDAAGTGVVARCRENKIMPCDSAAAGPDTAGSVGDHSIRFWHKKRGGATEGNREWLVSVRDGCRRRSDAIKSLAFLLGLEGVALLRAFAGVGFDRAFVEARIAETRALLDHAYGVGDWARNVLAADRTP
jgi:hypothetical protein